MLDLNYALPDFTSGLQMNLSLIECWHNNPAMFRDGEVHKTYLALCCAAPSQPEGLLEDWMERNEKLNKSFITADSANPEAKLASLDYRLLATSKGGYHLLEIELHTGRHHQIRCQLAHMGCPVKGDLKYGAPRSNPDGSISLHAYRVSFDHPVRHQPVVVTAPQPWQNMFQEINSEKSF